MARMNSGGRNSTGSSQKEYVAVISIHSPILKYDQECGPKGTRTFIALMEEVLHDPAAVGVVLDIDSGGGQASGTPEFYDFIRNYTKPVVTYTNGFLGSAAYYIGSAADHIVAHPRADAIGSIGAYTEILDLSGFYEQKGAKVHTFYADKSTEKNSEYREVLQGNYKPYLQKVLNPLVETFIADMKAARATISEDVFNGATYAGPVALEKGLVDSLGTLNDAIEKVFSLKNSKSTNTKNEMSKPNSYPNLEATLGLESPLAVNDNGSYLNEEQKTAIETTLADNATALKAAQDAQAIAEQNLQAANEAHEAALKTANDTHTSTIAALRDAATLAGVENLAEDASSEDIQAALTAQIQVLNGKPGATHTTAASNDEQEGNEHPYLDFDNSIYNQLKN